jgi:hypothetical protein
LFWIARGYRPIVFLEITRIQHGSFRSGLESEQEAYPCPVCQCACRAITLGEGVTRKTLDQFGWELVETPLMAVLKRMLVGSPDELVKPRKKPKSPHLRKSWCPNELRPLWR